MRRALAATLLTLVAGLRPLPLAAAESTAQVFPQIAILCYHDISDDAAAPLQTVPAAFLRAQIRACKARGWTFLSLSELLARREHPETLPPRVLGLTFDDGYKSFAEQALPVLKAEGVRPTLTVISSFVDAPPGGLPALLGWLDLSRLDASGEVELASHSHALHRYETSNPALDSAPAVATRRWRPELGRYEDREEYRSRVGDDLVASQRALQSHLGHPVSVLAWPYGVHNEMARAQAARAGFPATLSLAWRAVTRADLAGGCLPRIMVTRHFDFTDSASGWLAPPEAPVRAAGVDLDALWNADEHEFRARLEQTITRLRALGATDVILPVCPAPGGDGRVARAYAMNHQVPVLADVWSLAAAKFAAAGLKLWLRAPSLNLSWAWDRHPEWRLKPAARRGGTTVWRTRLSPELPGVRTAAGDFFTDLAVYLPLEGVVFDGDACVAGGEQLATPPTRTAAQKAQELRALLEGCKQAVRAWRPGCRFARVLSAGVLDRVGVDGRVAQDYEESLAADDLTFIELDADRAGASADRVLRIARRAVARGSAVEGHADAPSVVLMLPTRRAHARDDLAADAQTALARAALRAGVRHLGTGPVAAAGPLPIGLLDVRPAPPGIRNAASRY